MWWLLMTGRFPTNQEFEELEQEWRVKGVLKESEINYILSLPNTLHPMTMLSMTVLYLQQDS
jgi:citrate synthase